MLNFCLDLCLNRFLIVKALVGEVGEGPVRGLLRALWNIAKFLLQLSAKLSRGTWMLAAKLSTENCLLLQQKLNPAHGSWVITDHWSDIARQELNRAASGVWVIQEIHIDPLAVSRLSKRVDINNVEKVVQIKFHKILNIYLYALLCAVLPY